jgi:hypothetical protein
MFWNESTTCSGGDCLVSWEMACRLRSEGGLDLIDLGVQNTCLLLKNVYKLLAGVDNPWTICIRHWYFGGGSPPPTTPLLRSFKDIVPLLCSITSVTVGDGVSTSFWLDNWTSPSALSLMPSPFCSPSAWRQTRPWLPRPPAPSPYPGATGCQPSRLQNSHLWKGTLVSSLLSSRLTCEP